ncbi:MAG: hypothetical protein WBP67_15625, partial [Thermoanaerobaculia bacterium]
MSEKRANPCILLSSSLPDPGVFESQVIGTGRILELLGFQVSYRVMAGLRDWARFRRRTRAQLDGLRG